MQQRVPLLFVTGALAFGSLGYFLFFADDGSTPHGTSLRALPQKRPGGGAGRPTGSAAASVHMITPGERPTPGMPTPGATPPAQIATTPEPANTAPPE